MAHPPGTPRAICDFGRMIDEKSTKGINATTYIKMMGHTAPVNLGVFLGVTGRIITTSSACTSGSQGIGYGYEAVRSGQQRAMIAGGAEELCVTEAAVFDTLFATSVRNDCARRRRRGPFDADRDGLVLGEGAGTLILEDWEHARARGATIYAESRRLRHEQRRLPHHPSQRRDHAQGHGAGPGRRRLVAIGDRLRQRPRYRHTARATSPNRRRLGTCSAAKCR
jgi:3-oxoacyl-[acyl-carrier-protein] synthase III